LQESEKFRLIGCNQVKFQLIFEWVGVLAQGCVCMPHLGPEWKGCGSASLLWIWYVGVAAS